MWTHKQKMLNCVFSERTMTFQVYMRVYIHIYIDFTLQYMRTNFLLVKAALEVISESMLFICSVMCFTTFYVSKIFILNRICWNKIEYSRSHSWSKTSEKNSLVQHSLSISTVSIPDGFDSQRLCHVYLVYRRRQWMFSIFSQSDIEKYIC